MTRPDLILHRGRVFAAVTDAPPATAVAVLDGRIAAVGGDELLDLAGPGTRVIDAAGGMIAPGFQDAHAHPVFGAIESLGCSLVGLTTREACLDAVAAYDRANPGTTWLQGAGWIQSCFPGGMPTAADLDAVLGARPAFLWASDGHRAWVNSAALAAAGIDRHTPDPADGRIARDADGNPTGVLFEGAANLVATLLPEYTAADLDGAVQLAQRTLHAFGITAWHDAILSRAEDGEDPAEAYLRADRAGALTARVSGALWWDRARGLEQLPELLERRERFAGTRFRTPAIKLMQDGIIESETAALLAPYRVGHEHGGAGHGGAEHSGLSFIDPEVLIEAAIRLDAAGFQLHFHGIGDRAVRESLDAVAAARAANGPSSARHQLSHVQLVHPDDVPRFAELDVTVNYQAYWASNEPLMVDHTIPVLGPERAARQYPFRSLHAAGARLAAGSDWPVSTPDPLAGIHVAVNRTLPPGHAGRVDEPFLPEQALDVATALTAYTAGAASVNHLDDTGRIAPGFLADLVVLDRDPLEVPADEIGTIRVIETLVEGSSVYARD